jgi:dCMP deaminase
VSDETRADWDETWLEVARTVAKRSRCERDQVGAVIVDPRNRIVATGYNGPPAGFPAGVGTFVRGQRNEFAKQVRDCSFFCKRAMHGPSSETLHSYVDCCANRAEVNALSVCDRSVREGGTLYVSSDVCMTCAKIIANSGLVRVVVGARTDREYRRASEGYAFMRMCGITVEEVLP